MEKYIYFWAFWIGVRAIYNGHNLYKEHKKAGYNVPHYEKTGQMIKFHGGAKEAILCTLSLSLGLLLRTPLFWVLETLYSIPAMIVLYFIYNINF